MVDRDMLFKLSHFIKEVRYNFHETDVPASQYECGCVLGWAAYLYGDCDNIIDAAEKLGWETDTAFYSSMNAAGEVIGVSPDHDWMDNRDSASQCLYHLGEIHD